MSTGEPGYAVPRIPASAGALIFDREGRLLILKPTYKKGWTIPGGQIDPGESPWAACRREAREECGLDIDRGRLVCVDFLAPRTKRPGGVRFVFNCGVLADDELDRIELDEFEIAASDLVPLDQALELLSGPLRRRVGECADADECIYLEEGRRVPEVRPGSWETARS